MHHPNEPRMYSRNKFLKTNEIPLQCFYKSGDAEINKNQEYSNLIHIYYDAYHARYLSDRRSVTLTVHLLNDTFIDWLVR